MIYPNHWKQSGQYFDFKGRKIFYRSSKQGEGTCILLIHGFPTSSWDWYKMWPELESSFKLLAPDMLGFGFSDKPHGHAYSIAEQADILEDALKQNGINKIHILAHDYGDTVAQELLARQIESKGNIIQSMTLLNGGLFPEMHRPRPIQKLLISPLGGLLVHLMGRSAFNKSFSAVFGASTRPTEEELTSCWEMIQYNNGQLNFHRLIRYMEERKQNRARWVDALQKTDVPLLLINGPVDPVSGRHMTEHYKKLIPNPRIVLLEGIGHYPQLEAAEKCVAYFKAFINEIAS